MVIRLFIMALIMAPLTVLAASKIYTWTDENGVIHYGDRPPASAAAEEVAIDGKVEAPVEINEDQLPGQWYGPASNGGDVKVTLNASGTINFLQTLPDQSVFNYQGIWTLGENRIEVITEFSQTAPRNGDFQRSVEPLQFVYNILEFDADNMEWIIEGNRFELEKIN